MRQRGASSGGDGRRAACDLVMAIARSCTPTGWTAERTVSAVLVRSPSRREECWRAHGHVAACVTVNGYSKKRITETNCWRGGSGVWMGEQILTIDVE
eukprot:4785243-Prymnesium_polylepis.1